jgi:hypothetical protein
MLLSDSILIGSVGRKQIKYKLADGFGGVCAMGASDIGETGVVGRISWVVKRGPDSIRERYSKIRPCECPVCKTCYFQGGVANDPPCLIEVVIHLNNEHSWTFSQISRWVRKQEVKLGWVKAECEEPHPDHVEPADPEELPESDLPSDPVIPSEDPVLQPA